MKEDDCNRVLNKGDQLFRVGRDGIEVVTIMKINNYISHCVYKDDRGHSFYNHSVGKNYFLTREEAEEEVQKRENVVKKRRMLKEYEMKLNEELGIKNHFIVK